MSVLTPTLDRSVDVLCPPGDASPATCCVCHPGWEAISVCQGKHDKTERRGRRTHAITITGPSWGFPQRWCRSWNRRCPLSRHRHRRLRSQQHRCLCSDQIGVTKQSSSIFVFGVTFLFLLLWDRVVSLVVVEQ